MRDVAPLKPGPALVPDVPAAEPAPKIFEPPPAPVAAATVPKPGGVDGATLTRLKRGKVEVDGRIDLHGMDQRAAFATLLGFVDTASRTGRRALLVITGKGPVSQGGGVLRRNVPAWLMASPLAGRILAIEPAHLRHGGEGAFYVLLRRKRP
ncbi:MAG TPA: Smr/MutS family protein [Alphaproteobacteria bacterium]|jgi:DNA-nicking Smr family endonuclease|nr:Smr/MutS family protein [Alphaproteobacteria bacterium]